MKNIILLYLLIFTQIVLGAAPVIFNGTKAKWLVPDLKTQGIVTTDSNGVSQSLTEISADLNGNVVGNVTGNLTGNVTGNLTGDVTGNTTGNLTGDVTGNADTATSLLNNPTDCAASQFANAIDVSGDLTCAQVDVSDLSGALPGSSYQTVQLGQSDAAQRAKLNFQFNFQISDDLASDATNVQLANTISADLAGNAQTATSLAANPFDCSGGEFAQSIDAQGNLTCDTPTVSNLLLTQIEEINDKTILGNNDGTASNPEALTATEVTALLDEFTGDSGSGGVKGLVKVPVTGDAAAFRFLSADGTWARPVSSDAAAAGSTVEGVTFSDKKAQNSNGGSTSTGSFIKRTLNTLDNPDSVTWASLASDQITLDAGTYQITGNCPLFATSTSACRLQNVTDATTAIRGMSGSLASSGSSDQVGFPIQGTIDITAQKTFEVQYRVGAAVATIGLGVATNFQAEQYTTINIIKLSD